jgi:hypothetical protein
MAALELSQEFGLALFPLVPRGKLPLIAKDAGGSGLHDATSHPEQVCAWWDRWPDANIGAVPGSIDCIVIDCDGPEGEELARSLGVLDVSTCRTITPRGAHYWFRLPQGRHVGNIPRAKLDVRGHNGYVLVPPSIHPSGGVYAWDGSLSDVAPAPAGLLAWLDEQAERREARERDHQRRSDCKNTVAGTVDELTAKRVLRYFDKVGYGLADGRKLAAFGAACFLVHDVGLGDGLALQLLAEWNAGNAPPLPDWRIEEILANARKYGGAGGKGQAA